jgi:hypothetical protein
MPFPCFGEDLIFVALIVGLSSLFASLTVGETKCPAKVSVPARLKEE